MLVKSVHELEETTARLLTHKTSTLPSLPPSLPSSSFVEEMSAKSLSEIDDLLEALGFGGGVLHHQHGPPSLPPSPPTSGSQDGWEGGREGDPTLPPPPQPRQHHAYKKREGRRGGREGGREGGKVGCLVRWLEGVGRYHEERLQEGWERLGRWFL